MARKPKKESTPAPITAVAAIAPAPAKTDQGKVVDQVMISAIKIDSRNDRLGDADESLAELADSIRIHGLLQPIVLGRINGGPSFVLVAGHRRLAAVKQLGWTEVRAVVREYSSDEELQLDRAAENTHRLQLNPVEEAFAVGGMLESVEPAARQQLADEALASNTLAVDDVEDVRYTAQVRKRSIELVARKLGKSVTWVTDRAFLTRLGPKEQALVQEGRLPLNYAREICKVADPSRRSSLAHRFAAGTKHGDRPGDFSELRSAVADNLMSLAQVPWRLDVAWGKMPACQSCPKNSANQARLFEHIPPSSHGTHYGHESFKEPAAGVCTDKECFKEKAVQANRQVVAKGKSIARRINDLPKGERPGVSAKSIAELGAAMKIDVPKYLEPSRLATRVNEEMAIKVQSKSKSSSRSGNSSSSSHPQKSAAQLTREEAELTFIQDLEERQAKLEKAILLAVSKDPMRKAALAVLAESTLWHQLGSILSGSPDSRREPARKAAKKPGVQQLINLVANPTLEGFRMAGEFLTHNQLGYDGIEPTTDVVDRLAKALGLDVPPRPVLKEPPKEAAPKQDGPAARAKGKKGKAAKGTPAKPDGGVDLSEGNDLEDGE